MIYCERMHDTAFWAEPVNALTNLFFMLGAIIAYTMVRKRDITPRYPSYLLAGMLFLIGLGSFLWHTVAEPWAETADVIPIMLFILLYILFFSKVVLGYSYLKASGMVVGFFLFSFVFGSVVDMTWLNGGIGYLPPILYLFFLTYLTKKPELIKKLLLIAAVFVVSLTFRSIDMSICECRCVGTHFMWHTLNALFLFLLIRFMVRFQERG